MSDTTRDLHLLAARDPGWRCAYCAVPLADPSPGTGGWDLDLALDEYVWNVAEGYWIATRDHIVPKSLGGTDDLENLVPACRTCNSTKGTKSLLIFLAVRAGCPRFKRVGVAA